MKMGLDKISDGMFVPGKNIQKVRSISDSDRHDFEAKTGRPLRSDFRTQVETRAGLVLGVASAETIMDRLISVAAIT